MLQSSPTPPRDAPAGIARYSELSRTLHWITLLVIFSILPLGWVMVHMAKDAPNRDIFFMVHKSFGLLALALIITRLVWRAIHKPPHLPPQVEKWEAGLAHATHFFLYAIFIIMPVSGYVLSSAGAHPPSFFGLPLPQMAKNKDVSEIANTVHMIGQYFVYLFLAAHILGVIWHVAYRKDGYLDRMLPEQVNAE